MTKARAAKVAVVSVVVALTFAILVAHVAADSNAGARTKPGYTAVWPKPQNTQPGSETYTITRDNFQFRQPNSNFDILNRAFARYQKLVFYRDPTTPSGWAEWLVSTLIRGDTNATPAPVLDGTDGAVTSLEVHVKSTDETLKLETPEDYVLTIKKGVATLESTNVYGALKGLETFSQVVAHVPGTYGYVVDEVEITDAPRFHFRGLMIDTARHYLPKNVILANIDAMSYNKMNVLHWHIVDDQSFPFVSETYPLLHQKGAYNPQHIYTHEDIAEIIEYAHDRGIRVIPEFDTPGHVASWGKAYPELVTDCSGGSSSPFSPPLNPIVEGTYTFLKNFFAEVASVFGDDYIHLGGDEVPFDCWQNNADITAWMKAKGWTDYGQLEGYYEQKLLDIVGGLGKQYIVWQEVFNNGAKVLPDTVVNVWKGFDNSTMAKATAAGYRVVLSGCWYLDHLNEDFASFYKCEPTNFEGDAKQKSLVMGGQACMWGETVDGSNFMARVWPRAAAVAERLWSPEDTTDWTDALNRFNQHRCRMLRRDIAVSPLEPSYCDQEYEYKDGAHNLKEYL
eukprot:GFYU01006382.1.p1 GENE.GFYU01006382.1~~GFYU01006382.1.p1  ORF type:complete len:565 (+),score=216.74 GFYU01006382.1:165-1859(+)